MALTDLERLRLQIQDQPRVELREVVGVGDGVNTGYQVQLYPVVSNSEEVLVANVLQVRGSDYTIDDSVGLLTFSSAPDAGDEITLSYRWSTFSDAELTDLLAVEGSVTRAAINALLILLADTERFIKYTFGQESVDRTSARQNIEYLLGRLECRSKGPMALVKADTPCRKALLSPYLEQDLDCG